MGERHSSPHLGTATIVHAPKRVDGAGSMFKRIGNPCARIGQDCVRITIPNGCALNMAQAQCELDKVAQARGELDCPLQQVNAG